MPRKMWKCTFKLLIFSMLFLKLFVNLRYSDSIKYAELLMLCRHFWTC